MNFRGAARTMPTEVAALLTSWVRGSSLVPVARLRTLRRSTKVVDGEGTVLAEVVDDEVSVRHGRKEAARFREVEAEVTEHAPEGLLDGLVARLRAAGAGPPDPTSKVMRALGPVAAGPPDLVEEPLGSDPTAADVIRLAVTRSVRRLLAHDPGVRLGDDPEDVHQARVATRRLRSDLRTFRDLLDADWAQGLRDRLKVVATALGGVRDADVLLERLHRQVTDLPADDRGPGEAVLDRLRAERDDARKRLAVVMDAPDYAVLLDDLVEAARNPVLTPETSGPADRVLPPLVERPWRHLARAAKAVGPDSPDDELHQVRIRAKRCRYAAEVVGLAVGRPAQRFADAVADVQEVLGDHQDAVVTQDWLRRHVEGASPAQALVAGELVAASRADAVATRAAWPDAWAAARKGKLRTWMKA
jgi:CHAD domain-containing protein